MEGMLNICHVIHSTIDNQQPGKVLVHCHAGLGRTGLVIACYLIFSKKCSTPDHALDVVRHARPGSIQKRQQKNFLKHFFIQLRTMWIVYHDIGMSIDTGHTEGLRVTKAHTWPNSRWSESKRRNSLATIARRRSSYNSTLLRDNSARRFSSPTKSTYLEEELQRSSIGNPRESNRKLSVIRALRTDRITFDTFMIHQGKFLCGKEHLKYRDIPRVVHEICTTLERLFRRENGGSLTTLAGLQRLFIHKAPSSAKTEWFQMGKGMQSLKSTKQSKKLQIKYSINGNEWFMLRLEKSASILLELLMDWFDQLSCPMLDLGSLSLTNVNEDDMDNAEISHQMFNKLEEQVTKSRFNTVYSIVRSLSFACNVGDTLMYGLISRIACKMCNPNGGKGVARTSPSRRVDTLARAMCAAARSMYNNSTRVHLS